VKVNAVEVRTQAVMACRPGLLDSELPIVGVRRGLAHGEHYEEQAKPRGHDDQYDNTEIHLSVPFEVLDISPNKASAAQGSPYYQR
jgi:hypothetical protein